MEKESLAFVSLSLSLFSQPSRTEVKLTFRTRVSLSLDLISPHTARTSRSNAIDFRMLLRLESRLLSME